MVGGGVCTNCGATVSECNEHIKEHGEGCCGSCLLHDTHGFLDAPVDHVNAVESNLIASMALLRTDLMKAVEVAGQTAAVQQQRIDKLEERLTHFDHEQAVVDYGFLDTLIAGLEDRVDVLERCIADIERIFKLRRKE